MLIRIRKLDGTDGTDCKFYAIDDDEVAGAFAVHVDYDRREYHWLFIKGTAVRYLYQSDGSDGWDWWWNEAELEPLPKELTDFLERVDLREYRKDHEFISWDDIVGTEAEEQDFRAEFRTADLAFLETSG
jgi:hypothetical protein